MLGSIVDFSEATAEKQKSFESHFSPLANDMNHLENQS